MSGLMNELGYSYMKGEKRQIYMESDANVAFRAAYLKKKLANRNTTVGHNGNVYNGVHRPEVYLDELDLNC
eukprot:jgi/Phyca11/114208/e_gw1.25.593.1